MINKLMIIGDTHSHPGYDNKRFEALGKFMLKEKPDLVIQTGDFADMPSLSSYDKGKRSFEGRRYKDDVDSVIDAQEKLFAPFKAAKKKKPKLSMTLGNHENRINTATQLSPELHGTISIDDLQYKEFGWEICNYKDTLELEGIFFSHYFPSGIMGRPISGENIGATLCRKQYNSVVVGHSHIFDYAERTNAAGTKLFGMSAGCFVHPDYKEDWCANVTSMWFRGVIVLEGVEEGYYHNSLRIITQKHILDTFK